MERSHFVKSSSIRVLGGCHRLNPQFGGSWARRLSRSPTTRPSKEWPRLCRSTTRRIRRWSWRTTSGSWRGCPWCRTAARRRRTWVASRGSRARGRILTPRCLGGWRRLERWLHRPDISGRVRRSRFGPGFGPRLGLQLRSVLQPWRSGTAALLQKG